MSSVLVLPKGDQGPNSCPFSATKTGRLRHKDFYTQSDNKIPFAQLKGRMKIELVNKNIYTKMQLMV